MNRRSFIFAAAGAGLTMAAINAAARVMVRTEWIDAGRDELTRHPTHNLS
jgi:hypothetical protein